MIRRVLAAAFAASLVLPAAGSAQLMPLQDDPTWTPSLRITPFVGWLTGVTRREEWLHSSETEFRNVLVDYELAGGSLAGVSVVLPFRGDWGITGAAAYGKRGEPIFTPQNDARYRLGESKLLMGRAGVNLNLRQTEDELTMRRLNASVFAGGVAIYDRPTGLDREFISDALHLGLNFGVVGELPFLSDRFAVQAAIEDNVLWWDEKPLRDVAHAFFLLPDDARAFTTATADVSHAWLLRAGISFRFR